MKLAVSNIGWNSEKNDEIFLFMKENGYCGLEIAPTIIIQENPYDHIDDIKLFSKSIKEKYNLDIISMQSIWYGHSGNIFNLDDQKNLLDYTKKAIIFAESINCKNLVFGCPKNRIISDKANINDVIPFFKELGDYALEHHTVLSLEANPKIYNTNFLNETMDAIDFVKKVNSKGFMVNLDFGTIIENKENLYEIIKNIKYINHIHISEPYLVKILNRKEHKELAKAILKNGYNNYVSIEMKNTGNIDDIKDSIRYVKEIFES